MAAHAVHKALVWGPGALFTLKQQSPLRLPHPYQLHPCQHIQLCSCLATKMYLNPPTSFALSFAAGFPLNAVNCCLATKYLRRRNQLLCLSKFHVTRERDVFFVIGSLQLGGGARSAYSRGKNSELSGTQVLILDRPKDPCKVYCRVGTGQCAQLTLWYWSANAGVDGAVGA